MLSFLVRLRDDNRDNENALKAINEIENELNEKKYGLVWEEHSERVDEMMVENVPILLEDKSREIPTVNDDNYNFLIEGDNLHSLKLLEKTHREKLTLYTLIRHIIPGKIVLNMMIKKSILKTDTVTVSGFLL